MFSAVPVGCAACPFYIHLIPVDINYRDLSAGSHHDGL